MVGYFLKGWNIGLQVTANLETALINRDLKGQMTNDKHIFTFPWWYEAMHIILVLLVQNLTFLLKPTDNRAVKDFILNQNLNAHLSQQLSFKTRLSLKSDFSLSMETLFILHTP